MFFGPFLNDSLFLLIIYTRQDFTKKKIRITRPWIPARGPG
jgi:hypothetical protein